MGTTGSYDVSLIQLEYIKKSLNQIAGISNCKNMKDLRRAADYCPASFSSSMFAACKDNTLRYYFNFLCDYINSEIHRMKTMIDDPVEEFDLSDIPFGFELEEEVKEVAE